MLLDDVDTPLQYTPHTDRRYHDDYEAAMAKPNARRECRCCSAVLDECGGEADFTVNVSPHVKAVMQLSAPLCASCVEVAEVISAIDHPNGTAAEGSWVAQTRQAESETAAAAVQAVGHHADVDAGQAARRQEIIRQMRSNIYTRRSEETRPTVAADLTADALRAAEAAEVQEHDRHVHGDFDADDLAEALGLAQALDDRGVDEDAQGDEIEVGRVEAAVRAHDNRNRRQEAEAQQTEHAGGARARSLYGTRND